MSIILVNTEFCLNFVVIVSFILYGHCCIWNVVIYIVYLYTNVCLLFRGQIYRIPLLCRKFQCSCRNIVHCTICVMISDYRSLLIRKLREVLNYLFILFLKETCIFLIVFFVDIQRSIERHFCILFIFSCACINLYKGIWPVSFVYLLYNITVIRRLYSLGDERPQQMCWARYMPRYWCMG